MTFNLHPFKVGQQVRQIKEGKARVGVVTHINKEAFTLSVKFKHHRVIAPYGYFGQVRDA